MSHRDRAPNARTVKRHVRNSLVAPTSTLRLECGPLSASDVAQIQLAAKLDLTGYRRVMDSGDVRHVMKRHGDAAREQARKPPQLPISPGDFAKVSQIVARGTIVGVRSPKRGALTLTYQTVLGRTCYTLVEQVRNGVKQVALKSL